ncbi:MAG TPA: FHA domain-containing protein [Pyrinomonadaceae bacterium]|nr:FHA domain-containing protein [Pyrinomonadaceae bacterium]
MAIRLIISRPGVPVEERSFDDEIVTIGSDPGATLRLTDPSIAPEQAIVIREDGRPLLINRAPGTVFNGELLPREARRPLSGGDRIEFGPYAVGVAAAEGDPEVASGYATRPEEVRRERPDERDAADPRGGEGGGASPDARAREQQQQQGRSFAAILDSLRTEEDSFYFVVESAAGQSRRVRLEAAETMIGWDETGRRISCDAATVLAARAVVRKDWSGVVALPLSPGMIRVNGETVEAPRRLRDGDRVTLLRVTTHEPEDDCLVFHEPASLVVLDSLLPQQQQAAAPPSKAAAPGGAGEASSLARPAPAALEAKAATSSPERRYFGYFTPLEVLVMVVGTLVTAAIIFIILELYA